MFSVQPLRLETKLDNLLHNLHCGRNSTPSHNRLLSITYNVAPGTIIQPGLTASEVNCLNSHSQGTIVPLTLFRISRMILSLLCYYVHHYLLLFVFDSLSQNFLVADKITSSTFTQVCFHGFHDHVLMFTAFLPITII